MPSTTTSFEPITVTSDLINGFFHKSINDAMAIGSSYEQLWKSLFMLINSGGKKLRPRMTFLAYEMFGGTNLHTIAPVAAAQELLHFSLLIHDDIIDRDYKRYGVANIAGQYKELYSPFIEHERDKIHYAHSAALLAGDLMLSGAYQLIVDSLLDNEEKTIALQFLSSSIFEVAGGELLDTESSFMPHNDGDAINIARYKTAGYSFISPLLTGASLAKASEQQKALVQIIGENLGIAFQLTDDLLGIYGEESLTGKPNTSDIIEGKQTYLVEKARHAMTKDEKNIFNSIFNNRHASDDEIEWVRKLFISTKAKEQTENQIIHYTNNAKHALDLLQLDKTHSNEFSDFIDNITKRRY